MNEVLLPSAGAKGTAAGGAETRSILGFGIVVRADEYNRVFSELERLRAKLDEIESRPAAEISATEQKLAGWIMTADDDCGADWFEFAGDHEKPPETDKFFRPVPVFFGAAEGVCLGGPVATLEQIGLLIGPEGQAALAQSEQEAWREENKALRDTIASIEEKEKRRSKLNKTDIKRLRALVTRMEQSEKAHQETSGDPWPRSRRAVEKNDCAALARILKLLDSGEVA